MNTAAAWRLEHKQFVQFLAFLESQLAIIGQGDAPNYDLMSDVTHYLCHFGARYHHARETVAFGYILEKDPAMSGTIRRLALEHTDNVARGENLDALLAGSVAGDAATQIAEVLASFIDAYRSHVAAEEQEVLPYAEANLSDGQWEGVARAAPSGPDPFVRFATSRHNPTFGSEAQTRYRALCERIQTGRSSQPWAHHPSHLIKHALLSAAATKAIGVSSPTNRSLLLPATANERRLLVRQSMELLLLSLAFLQYQFLDAQLQILNLASVFPDLGP